MPIQLSSKLPDVGTTIFTVMSQMAADHGALNLSQGFPDFDGPEALLASVNHHLHNGKNQYAPMTGVPQLREQIARKIETLYGRKVDSNQEVTITSGATEALFSAIHAVVHPGDEVIVFDPAYDSYEPAIHLAGGHCIHIPLDDSDFSVDWNRFKSALTPKTRLVIINSPHNPTGSVWSKNDMDTLAELLENTNCLVLSDEVYEHIVFDGAQHQSVLRHEALAARSFVVSSFGKTYHVTGWKIGYCVAPPFLSEEFRKVHQFVTFDSITPVQLALADFMESCPEHYQELPAFYQKKRDTFCRLVQDSRFQFTPAQGTYFQLLDYSAITDLPDTEYANQLTQEKGIASIPISVFSKSPSSSRYLRFCFAKDDSTLEKAAEILCKI